MTFNDAVTRLERAFEIPLPGARAHALMAPRPRRNWPPGFSIDRIRHAAALLLVYPIADRAHVVVTERSRSLDRHGGQISLPGGVVETGESHREAALREAEEEIGLSPERVAILGELSAVDIPVSGFRLHPVVATTPARPQLTAAQGEVARILDAPLDHLIDPARIAWREMARDTGALRFPVFLTEDVEIWGATAMVLAELLTMLGWPGPDLARF